MIFQPVTGALYLVKGFKLLLKPGIRLYVIMPMLINFLLFTLFIWASFTLFNDLLDNYLSSFPVWLQWLEWVIWPLFTVTFFLLGLFISLSLANLVAAPFNGLLAEAVEHHLTGTQESTPGNWLAVVKDIIPAVMNEIKKITYYCIRAIPLLILFIIPGVNIIASFMWMLFSAWMLALEYLDYPMANHSMAFADIRKILTGRRFLSLGFGGATMFLMLVPVVNFIAMPIAVAGATVMYVEKIRAEEPG